MNVTHLRAFHAVARHGGYAAAAAATFVSQPTLSEQVHALERQYGVRLFERSGRGVRLTTVGTDLFEETSRLAAVLDDAERLLTGARELTTGTLRIGADAAVHVVGIVAELRRRHPGLTVTLRSANTAVLLASLRAHEADLVVVADRPTDPAMLVVPLVTQRLVAFDRRDGPFAGRALVTLAELASTDLVLREPGSMTRHAFEDALAREGLEPRNTIDVDSREAVAAAVVAGLGVGVVAEDEFMPHPELRSVPIDSGPDLTEWLVMPTSFARTSAGQAVLAVLHDGR